MFRKAPHSDEPDTATQPVGDERSWWARLGSKGRWGLIGGGVVALLLVAGASAYGIYYGAGHRALPGTMIGDVSVSGKTRAEIASYVEKDAASHRIHVSGNNVHDTSANLGELGVRVDAAKMADAALARNSQLSSYFTAPFGDFSVDPVIEWEQPKLAAFASRLTEGVEGAYPATEPSVVPNDDHSAFVAVEGKKGRGIPLTDLLDSAMSTVANNKDAKVSARFGDVDPLLDIALAKKQAEAANGLVSPAVTVNVGDKQQSPNTQTRLDWVQIPGVGEANNTPTLNADAIKEWAAKASAPLIVKRVDGLRYVNERGEEVLKKINAVDGVNVTNTDAVASGIVEAVGKGQPFDGSFETQPDKAEWKDQVIAPGAENLPYPAAPGEKWIDINLSNNTTTAFEGSTVVRGPVSMVKGAPETPTVTGRYVIERKLRTDTMRGFNADGTRYVTPDVPYAMYFHSGYALHGAPWRSVFGLGVGGSHGCINMPVGEAGWFFNWAPTGTVVVSHY